MLVRLGGLLWKYRRPDRIPALGCAVPFCDRAVGGARSGGPVRRRLSDVQGAGPAVAWLTPALSENGMRGGLHQFREHQRYCGRVVRKVGSCARNVGITPDISRAATAQSVRLLAKGHHIL